MARRSMKSLTVRFTDDELTLLQDAAGDQAPEDFIREVVLSVAAASMEGEEGEPQEPGDDRDHGEESEDTMMVGTAAELIERLDQCMTMGRELIVRNRVLLGELLSHTRYRDASHEEECRAQARPRYREIEDRIRKLIEHDHEGPAH